MALWAGRSMSAANATRSDPQLLKQSCAIVHSYYPTAGAHCCDETHRTVLPETRLSFYPR
jgi:hypothetical protein